MADKYNLMSDLNKVGSLVRMSGEIDSSRKESRKFLKYAHDIQISAFYRAKSLLSNVTDSYFSREEERVVVNDLVETEDAISEDKLNYGWKLIKKINRDLKTLPPTIAGTS